MKRSGFTLIEMLVVIAIIALLSSLIVPAIGKTLTRAERLKEMNAGRTLGQALMMYAQDHQGRLPGGYADEPARDRNGNAIPHPVNARYPWRLAPYVNYAIEDVFLIGKDAGARADEDQESYWYRVSVFPALGMNVFFVGGDDSGQSGQGVRPIPAHEELFGAFCVTGLGQAVSPSSLISFASARHTHNGEAGPGYFKVTSPRFTGERWTDEWDPDLPADAFGFVDFRWDGKAVVTKLDGSVHLMGLLEMRDMRLWSDQAARANDPDWVLTRR